MTLLHSEEAAPPGSGPLLPSGGPDLGFLDCRGHWHRLDEPEDPARDGAAPVDGRHC